MTTQTDFDENTSPRDYWSIGKRVAELGQRQVGFGRLLMQLGETEIGKHSSRKSACYHQTLDDDTLLQMAQSAYKARRDRSKIFPDDFFAEPLWDMLLDLFCAKLKRKPVSVTSLCIASCVPATTALRGVSILEANGYIQRVPHPTDRRARWLVLSDKAFLGMVEYFSNHVSQVV